MFSKLDRVLKDVLSHGKSESEKAEIKRKEDIMTLAYKDVCNFAHINYNAHLSVGMLKGDTWTVKLGVGGYKSELYAFYMPAFIWAIEIMPLLCGIICRNSKVNNYNLLSSEPYFE